MTVTADHRSRLSVIRERTHSARAERSRARQLLDAARDDHDNDAAAVAQIAFDRADEELQVAERLESQLLSSMAGIDSSPVGGGIFDNPAVVEQLQRLGESTSFPLGTVDLGPLSTREQLIHTIESGSWGQPKMAAAGPVSVPDSARVGAWGGVIPQLRRPLSVLDLLPVAP